MHTGRKILCLRVFVFYSTENSLHRFAVGRVLVTEGTEGWRQKDVRCWPEGHDVLGRRSRGVGQKITRCWAEGRVSKGGGTRVF